MNLLKMSVFILFPFLVGCCFLVGCGSSEDTKSQPDVSEGVATLPGAVEAYVSSDAYIDVDVSALEMGVVNPSSSASIDVEDIAKMKAAVYRYYKYVTVRDGRYFCSLKDHSEINVSENVFLALNRNLQEMNDFISECEENNMPVQIEEPTEEYFQALLK